MNGKERQPGRHECLAGYVILDLTHVLSGPLVTSILGCLGATIVKVEAVTGDVNRRQPPFPTSDGLAGEMTSDTDIGLSFLKRNVTKSSICLDLKTPAGMDALHRLARASDAFIHNFRPGVVERLGVSEADMHAINPRLVYCSVEGLGPYRVPGDDRGVVDLVAQALSGVMAATGHPGGPPTRSAAPIADTAAGLYGAVAVLAGLLERDGRRGKPSGSGFRVSMLSGLVSLLWDEHLDVLHRSGAPERAGNTIARTCPFNTFLTADDQWVAICAFSPAEWRRVLEATELTALRRPELDEQVARIQHRELIEGEIARWARSLPRAEVLDRLARAGASYAPVTTVADVLADEHYQRTLLYEVRHPVHGPTGAFGSAFPIIVDEQQVHPAPAPGVGQHTDAVLRELAGMTDAEIAALRASGAAR